MERLQKELTLLDVFVISTGAMFSSGFFLLPGIASAYTGPSVVLAYLVAGLLVLPTMLSKAELATAMPRAGGTYYYLDRSLGPLAGTIGGLGTWLSLIFKSAFALIGMGAYMVFFADLPIKPVAVGLTVLFTVLNVVGAKETTGLQRILVYFLLVILTFFIVQGVVEIFSLGTSTVHRTQFVPFFPFGAGGFVSTVGMVFVSYAGLTKVASVAEEIRNPDRNIPLGMGLSLGVVTFVYVVGIYVMVGVLDPDGLRSDLTPVATAASAFFDWLPGSTGLLLVVFAAFAAFASTGNAGLMSASRYPLAMARDQLVWPAFARIGRFRTPDLAIVVSAGVTIFFILALSEEGVVKLASAFTLFIFGLLNLAVIVMRESRIPSYVPGFRAPLYPWIQVAGLGISAVLIPTMGLMPLLFSLAVLVGGALWYHAYGRRRASRRGAIFHLFARWGKLRDEQLEGELRGILKEKEPPDERAFHHLVSRAEVIDLSEPIDYRDLVARAADRLSERIPASSDEIEYGLLEGEWPGATPVMRTAALPHVQIEGSFAPALLLVRSRAGISIRERADENGVEAEDHPRHAFFFMVSPEGDPGEHLQILATLARRIDEEGFMPEWMSAETEDEIRETLLHHDHYFVLNLRRGDAADRLIGRSIREIDLPDSTLVALVRRNGETLIPRGDLVFREHDRVTVIGDRESVRLAYHQFTTRSPKPVETQGLDV